MSTETMQFKTELKQILDIIIHSLYSHKDIFLRELISNASDAIDTLRFRSLTHTDLLDGVGEWKIKIHPDEPAGTLSITDNGIGMSRDTIVENLGTIAKSGTRALLEALQEADARERPELIGQFGVGFYSAFMVADRVVVRSREAGTPPEAGVRWESDGQGSFSVEDITLDATGTEVILHLKPDCKEFLNTWKIRQLVKQHSDFIEHPVVIDEPEGEDNNPVEKTLNSRQAIWLRPKSEITDQEYNDFYKHLTHDFRDPAQRIHFSVEGAVEFKALLYIPGQRPFDMMLGGDVRKGLSLYIRRVFIMDDCEALLPEYLRFVRGVVDSPDLPLNVSREMLQESAPLSKIRSNLVGKVLRSLAEMKEKEYDKYVAFYRDLGVFLKEGVVRDHEHREALADLLLVESTATAAGEFTTLAKYVEAMPAEQTEILYLCGENRELLEHSPLLEGVRAKGWHALFWTDPADEFLLEALTEYRGKKFRAIDRGNLGEAVSEEATTRFRGLLDFMKGRFSDLKDVRLSSRLKESAACLVSEEGVYSPRLIRMLRQTRENIPFAEPGRILELNPEHPAVTAVLDRFTRDGNDPRLEDFCHLLYDQAVVAEGGRLKDPASFARRLNELLVQDARATSGPAAG